MSWWPSWTGNGVDGATPTKTSESIALHAGDLLSLQRDGTADTRRGSGFLDGYRRESRRNINGDMVRYWELMATLGRAVVALEQGHRFVAGGEDSIELALRSRHVAEMEIDLLAETDRLAMERPHA